MATIFSPATLFITTTTSTTPSTTTPPPHVPIQSTTKLQLPNLSTTSLAAIALAATTISGEQVKKVNKLLANCSIDIFIVSSQQKETTQSILIIDHLERLRHEILLLTTLLLKGS
ncbi:hypothetical protein Tco_1476216 [Tanacetum coccineum]